MSKSIKVPKIAEIDGEWHYLKACQMGYHQWWPIKSSQVHRNIPNELKEDSDLGFIDAPSAVVDHLLDLVNVVLPDDFIAYLRREVESVARHMVSERVVLKADRDVVKLSVHISLDNGERVHHYQRGRASITGLGL